jgi:SAM-dependent methyltransferase
MRQLAFRNFLQIRPKGPVRRAPDEDEAGTRLARSFVLNATTGLYSLPTPARESRDATAEPAAERYDRLLSRFGPDSFPPLIIAIGLDGDLLEALDRRSASTRVLAIEPVAAVAAGWQARPQAREWLASGRLALLAGPHYEGRAQAWRLIDRRALNPPLIVSPFLQQHFQAETTGAKGIAKQIVLGAQANDEARKRFAGRYLLHTLTNLPTIAAEGDAAALDHLFPGVPAIVVGAGPSLDRNVAALLRLKDRALFIAVDTAVRPLLAAGIRPHLVVAVDPSELNGQHLSGLADTRGMWLVAEGSVHPTVFTPFAGRTFTFKVSGHDPWPWLAERGADRRQLQAWGSVLTTAFDLALRVGCDPIVFAGADLAYTDGLQYCRNTTYEEQWSHLETNAERAAEFSTYLRTQTHLAQADVAGREVITVPNFIQFRDWLVSQATAASPRRIINATGGGILHGGRIETAELESLVLPAAPVEGFDTQGRLGAAWNESGRRNLEAQERLEAALAYGAAIPFQSWLDFGGDTATRDQIVETARSAAVRVAFGRRKTAYLERHRASYDRRIATLEDARELSHGCYDVAARRAASQQAHVLLDFMQRTYEIAAPGLASVMEAVSTLPGAIRALDVGCGIGRLMEPLVEAGIDVDGVDISERMIHFARQSPTLAGSQFYVSRGNDCGAAPDAFYDLVYSQLCFRYISSRSVRNDLLAAMARALKPGGVLVVEMRFFPDLRTNAVPAPHVPWSADDFEPAGEAGLVDACPTLDELHLVYEDFSRHLEDVRLQFVDVAHASRQRLPPQMFVSGSTAGALATRMHDYPPAPATRGEAAT